ncbi:MAG: helix-turn-helix domain-containing protein [Bacteroidia bacterium]
MTDLSYVKMISMSDDALAKRVGLFIKHKRLEQNKTQDMVSSAAGISRSTLSLLERGEAVTLPTLIQVLRVLDPLHVLEVFEIKQRISPLAIAKAEKEKRKRASSKIKSVAHKSDWQS